MAKSVRVPTSLWSDPEWLALTDAAQLVAMTCMVFGKSGSCSEDRLARLTGWDMAVLAAARAEVLASKFEHVLEGTTRRRPMLRDVADAVKKRDGYACVYCASTESLEIDHVYPVKLGGSDDMDNLQTLCAPCNRRKGARVIANPVDQTRVLAVG